VQPQLQATLEKLQTLAAFLKAAKDNLQIHLRVFYDADSSEVDLLLVGD